MVIFYNRRNRGSFLEEIVYGVINDYQSMSSTFSQKWMEEDGSLRTVFIVAEKKERMACVVVL